MDTHAPEAARADIVDRYRAAEVAEAARAVDTATVDDAANRLTDRLERLTHVADQLEGRLQPILSGPGLAERAGPRDTAGRSAVAVRFHAAADIVDRLGDQLADLIGRVDL